MNNSLHPCFMFVAGFWDLYDPEGYSLWFCDYKYNDENTVSFVTLNKVGGFLQRMNLARKYAFGKMLVISSEPEGAVSLPWARNITFVLDECYDKEQKEPVNQMIEDHLPFKGEPRLDTMCFK